MPHYDGPPYPYTTTIPAGTAALRSVVAELFGIARTEVVRDRSRCADTPSEHCAARAVDFFSPDAGLRRLIFDSLVGAADALGVQSVITTRRVWGFGRWTERAYTGPSPHTDHVHVGLTVAASKTLTPQLVRSALATTPPHQPRKDLDMFTLDEIAAAVWEHAVRNNVDANDAPAHRVLSWAHQDANSSMVHSGAVQVTLSNILDRLEAIERKVAGS